MTMEGTMKEVVALLLFPTELAVSLVLWAGMFAFVAYEVLR
jgi:hypothetical protein